MMSLLSVTVKKARYVGVQASQFNTYVTLKLQNVKSTTVTVKGATPCWEQDFLFETNDLNTGLLIEVWSKGMIWDRAMGYHWIPLQTVQYSNEEGTGHWLSLEAELVMRDGEVVGTKNPTGHSLLVDCRFELPFDPENIEASDLQRKLEMLNNIMDQEARMEQARRQMQYFGHSGYSEDSDYTSDLNYPVGQHANSSASQFRSAAHQIHTPQRSLETSRENSYERDDGVAHQHHLPTPATHQHHLSPGSHRRHHQRYSPGGTDDYNYSTSNTTGHNTTRQYQDNSTDFDPLSYNSRPRNKPDYSRRNKYGWDNEESQDTWASCETSFHNHSVDSVDAGYSVDSEYYGSQQSSRSKARRPSLERQITLYDDCTFYGDPMCYVSDDVTQVNCVDISAQQFNQNQSCDKYYDTLSYPYQDERYGQDDEDRQWDSGGFPSIASVKSTSGKKLPAIPVQNFVNSTRRSSLAGMDDPYPGFDDPYRSVTTPTSRRRMPQIPSKRSASRQSSINDGYDNMSHRGASLPPTPTKTLKALPRVPALQAKPFNSLPPTPGRQLPKPNLNNHRSAKARRISHMKRTSSAEYAENADYDAYYTRPGAMSANQVYNEDYNYAYQSIDNLPTQELNRAVPDYGDELNALNANKNGTVSLPYQSQAIDDYYYNSQPPMIDQSLYHQDDDYYDMPEDRRKLLGKIDFLQQNTDSLESHDDELKDSFDTALSSVNSSMHQIKRPGYPEFSTTGLDPIINNTSAVTDSTIPVSVTQYQRDQQSPPKAIAPMMPSVTVVQVHNQVPFSRAQSRGMLKQQDSVDVTYLNQTPITNSYLPTIANHQESFHEDDAYLEPQESVESYVEEDSSHEYNGKAINDSPASVIHADGYGDDHSLRRGSSQITVVDPYHPSVQRPNAAIETYVPISRRASMVVDPFQRRTSGDLFLNNAQELDAYSAALLKPSSVVDYNGQSRRASAVNRLEPPPVVLEEVLDHEPLPDDDHPDKKSVSFDEEEDDESKHPRTIITAQQRWLWAYNKIIMQLNVSDNSI